MIILINSIILTAILAVILIIRKLFSHKLLPSYICSMWVVFILFAFIPAPLFSSPFGKDLGFSVNVEASVTDIKPLSEASDMLLHNAKFDFSFYDVVMLIWIAGIIIKLVHFICSNIKFNKALQYTTSVDTDVQASISFKENIEILSSDTLSPCVHGLFKNRIILSSDLLNKNDILSLEMILSHEYAHIKLGHLWISFFMNLVKIVYWFLPTVYLADYFMREDLENAADYQAIHMAGCGEAAYAQTFYQNLKEQTFLSSSALGISSSQKSRKKRLVEVLNFRRRSKKLTVAITIIASLTFISIFIFAMRDTDKYNGYSKADIEAAKEVIYDYYEHNENKNIRLVNVTYKPYSIQNRKFDGLFFTVDLDVTYTENGGGGFEEGLNKDWGIWLSKNKDSGKWEITDLGH